MQCGSGVIEAKNKDTEEQRRGTSVSHLPLYFFIQTMSYIVLFAILLHRMHIHPSDFDDIVGFFMLSPFTCCFSIQPTWIESVLHVRIGVRHTTDQ